MVQVTKRTSWFERLSSSISGVFVGAGLVIAMIAMLFWNEGDAVQIQRSLDEGAGLVVTVDASRVDPANEGKLVHLSGLVESDETPTDEAFGVSAEGLRLIRKVEMYQWVESSRTETKKNLGGSETQVTTYSYKQDWHARPQDSSRFREPAGHQNPAMIYENRSSSVSSAELGAFALDDNIISRIGGERPLPVQQSIIDEVKRSLGTSRPVNVVDGVIHIGLNPAQPRIGDYRVRFELVPFDTVSIVGQQRGTGLAAYPTQAGENLLMVRNGNLTAQAMFDQAASDNVFMTWLLRIVGIVLLMLGFSAILRPLAVLASVVPFFGSIVGAGTGLVAAAAGILVGTVTIASAWMFYRPVMSLIILGIGAAIVYALKRFMPRKAPQLQPVTS